MDISRIPAWEKRTKFTIGPCPRQYAGLPFRRILGEVTDNGKTFSFHATKGLRVKSTEPDGSAIAKLFMPPPVPQPPRYATTTSLQAYMKGGNFNG
jgi:hypothetical protein